MTDYNTHFHPDGREQNVFYEEQPFVQNKNIRSMPQGNDRLAALRDLGATFNEGQHRVTKIATPTGTPKLPTFVDAGQIEKMIQQKPFPSALSASGREDFGRFAEWR
ncbi:hypothetical protein K501DRAFT_249645 [Backusella circina FSU 941]|nr:hypothetical protein K501DRAFT_249645 [Backusella circina FSU 941]